MTTERSNLFGRTYSTIVMDPPWLERGGGKIKRGADRHYPLLKTKEMPNVIRRSGVWNPNPDCHLYVWVTNNFLLDGLWLIEQLGARYVTNVVWVKDRAGLGQYFRGQHELCLFAVAGAGYAVRTDAKDIPSVIHAPRGKHSAKPAAFYEMVERRSKGPRLEMFARDPREGWDVWGSEVIP